MAGYSTPAWSNLTAPPINGAAMLALGQAVELGQHPFGVCSTAANVDAKTVTIDFSGTLSLFAGLTVRVQFTNENYIANPTLNVNGTGAVPIMAFGSTSSFNWNAGALLTFVYDGTNWVYNGYDRFLRMDATGYTGTGAYGVGNPNTLTFDFEPMLLIVCNPTNGLLPYSGASAWQNSFIWVSEQVHTFVNGTNAASTLTFTQSGNSVSWYGGSAVVQLNESGVAYNAFAVGV